MNPQTRESDSPLLTLRIVLAGESEDNLTIEVSLSNERGLIDRCSVAVPAHAILLDTPQQDELRWYLEDFLMYPDHPAPKIAARIEKWIAEYGVRLFDWLFGPKSEPHRLWKLIVDRIGQVRIEAVWESKLWPLVPLEFLRPAEDQPPLAASAASFVHSAVQEPDRFRGEVKRSNPIRILLIISRPSGLSDIPFLSIGIPLLRSLSNRRDFRVETLRPPTKKALVARLNETKDQGRPFDIVHFDGHGIYDDLHARATGHEPKNMRGYLVFENPSNLNNQELITGKELGEYLHKAGVSYLILNACRSAHANTSLTPPWMEARTDQAYPSLAQEVLNAGIAGVVGMRYAVYVSTAVRFIDHLYTSLSQGSTLGEAVQLGRRRLLASASESPGPFARRIQDWCVPVIYESAQMLLGQDRGNTLPSVESDREWFIDENLQALPASDMVDRDEAIMEIEHALGSNHVVLLQGMAGSGKSVLAADFCRWYAFTSATAGIAVLTSLDKPKTLSEIFEQVESVICTRSVAGIPESVKEEPVRDRLLRLLKEIQVLWIWDGIEALSGLSSHGPSVFSVEEQIDLRKFLLETKDSKVKFLLTSRRDERRWLGDIPTRVNLSEMTRADIFALGQMLAARWNTQITDIDTWWPLVVLVRGNPLVTNLFFTQAFSEQLQSLDEAELFVQRINQGTIRFTNRECAVLAEKLSTSMGRGFEESFSEEELRYVALLHVWSHINASLLAAQGNPAIEHPLAWVSSFGIQEWTILLDRLADLGLIERYNEGNYLPHPALQWFLKGLFDRFYSGQEFAIYRAYVETLCLAVAQWLKSYQPGNPALVNALYTANADLNQALDFARIYALWDHIPRILSGLENYYEIKGYTEDWARVMEKVVGDCTDLKTGLPLSGRETLWLDVTRRRNTIAIRERRMDESARLSKLILDWVRGNENLGTSKVDVASALHELGRVLMEQQDAGCIAYFEEALRLARELDHSIGAARCAYNLANAYRGITQIKDLGKAEALARESLALRPETDYQAQAKSLSLLGVIIFEAYLDSESVMQESKTSRVEVVSPRKLPDKLPKRLQEAVRYLRKALKILPSDDVRNRADINSQLGSLFSQIGDVDRSLLHYREAIKEYDAAGRTFAAANMRLGVANVFFEMGRLMDAYEYAHAALEMLKPFGDQAHGHMAAAQSLIKNVAINLLVRGELPKSEMEGSISDYVTFINMDE